MLYLKCCPFLYQGLFSHFAIILSIICFAYCLGASLVAQMVSNLPAMLETWVRSLGWEGRWRRARQPTPVFLMEHPRGQRGLAWGLKESDTTKQPSTAQHGGFPSGSAVKNLAATQETWVLSWVGKLPWKRKWQPTPVFLPEKPHGQRSLLSYSPRGSQKSLTWLSG